MKAFQLFKIHQVSPVISNSFLTPRSGIFPVGNYAQNSLCPLFMSVGSLIQGPVTGLFPDHQPMHADAQLLTEITEQEDTLV